MELLVEEVAGEDDFARVKAFKRIRMIAEALGPEATEAELMPFLLGASSAIHAACYLPTTLIRDMIYNHAVPASAFTNTAEKSGENTEDEVLLVIAKELGTFMPLVKSPEVPHPCHTNSYPPYK